MLSAVVITLNEEKNIAQCLQSLLNVADEIVVVDSGSTDQTEQICRQFGSKIIFITQKWLGYARQKNFANTQTHFDFILSVDADEVLSKPLIAELLDLKKQFINNKNLIHKTYTLNRLTHYCGKPIRHCGWFPDKKVRLFNKNYFEWQGDSVHEQLVQKNGLNTKFTSIELRSLLNHYSYYTVGEHWHRIDVYSSLEAKHLFEQGKKVYFWHFIFPPTVKFLNMYVFKLGFLDGFEGFVLCMLSGYGRFLRYAKLKALRSKAL